MPMKPCPPVDPELVEWLSQVFPDRCPEETSSDRKVWIDVGAAAVVRKLRKEAERQATNALAQEVIR